MVRFRLPRHRFDRELLFGGGPFEFAEPCWYFTDSNLVRPAVLRVTSTSEFPDAGRNSSFGSYQTHDTPLLQVFDELSAQLLVEHGCDCFRSCGTPSQPGVSGSVD